MKLIKIEKDGCRPCQQLKLELHAYKDELEELGIEVEEINISETPEAIEEYEVMGVPTILLMEDDKMLFRYIGYIPAEKVLEEIKEIMEDN